VLDTSFQGFFEPPGESDPEIGWSGYAGTVHRGLHSEERADGFPFVVLGNIENKQIIGSIREVFLHFSVVRAVDFPKYLLGKVILSIERMMHLLDSCAFVEAVLLSLLREEELAAVQPAVLITNCQNELAAWTLPIQMLIK
jgi:hypothetical protein